MGKKKKKKEDVVHIHNGLLLSHKKIMPLAETWTIMSATPRKIRGGQRAHHYYLTFSPLTPPIYHLNGKIFLYLYSGTYLYLLLLTFSDVSFYQLSLLLAFSIMSLMLFSL